jgi:DNA mismatch endonuclease (patch repair protein)
VDGAFWHGHPARFTFGKFGTSWDAKIGRCMQRDRLTTETLIGAGWRVIRIWDFEVEADPEAAAQRVIGALEDVQPQRLHSP